LSLVFFTFFLDWFFGKIVAFDIVTGVIFVAEVSEFRVDTRWLDADGHTVLEEQRATTIAASVSDTANAAYDRPSVQRIFNFHHGQPSNTAQPFAHDYLTTP
jgi:hypothetical protein